MSLQKGIKKDSQTFSKTSILSGEGHSVFPPLDLGWERNFGIFRGRGGMKNFQRQGRNFLGGSQIFLDQAGGGTQHCDTKIILKIILIQK